MRDFLIKNLKLNCLYYIISNKLYFKSNILFWSPYTAEGDKYLKKKKLIAFNKLDRVSLIDKQPFTNLPHHFVPKKGKIWHVTPDMWHMVGGEHSLNISAPLLLRFGIDSVLKILN